MAFVCYTTMQQHYIDNISVNITMITESESTTGKKTLAKKCGYIAITFRQELTKGWEGGKKLLHCPAPARKEKLNHVTEPETNILARTQVPYSM